MKQVMTLTIIFFTKQMRIQVNLTPFSRKIRGYHKNKRFNKQNTSKGAKLMTVYALNSNLPSFKKHHFRTE